MSRKRKCAESSFDADPYSIPWKSLLNLITTSSPISTDLCPTIADYLIYTDRGCCNDVEKCFQVHRGIFDEKNAATVWKYVLVCTCYEFGMEQRRCTKCKYYYCEEVIDLQVEQVCHYCFKAEVLRKMKEPLPKVGHKNTISFTSVINAKEFFAAKKLSWPCEAYSRGGRRCCLKQIDDLTFYSVLVDDEDTRRLFCSTCMVTCNVCPVKCSMCEQYFVPEYTRNRDLWQEDEQVQHLFLCMTCVKMCKKSLSQTPKDCHS